MKRPLKFCFTLPALAFGLAPQVLFACSTCFGKSDSKMAEGMNAGIFTLLVVVVTVLAGIAAFFVFLARKSAAVNAGQN